MGLVGGMEENSCKEESDLRRRLKSLLALARDNEEKLRRFNDQELKLISATSLPRLLDQLLGELPKDFGLNRVTLTLVDSDQELQRILDLDETPAPRPGILLTETADRLFPLFPRYPQPFLGPFGSEHRGVFPDSDPPPASIALLPLIRGDELIGCLGLASREAERYTRLSRTDFLDRLAAITAICLENCVNHERIRQLGFTDPLTGVNNRRYFEERLIEAIATAFRKGQPLGCMLIDVDHFKRFNDTHGHQAGDQVLKEVAQRIRSELRRADVLCRYGGEEFVALLPATDRRSAMDTAERIRRTVAEHSFVFDGTSERVSVSVGLAVLAGPGKMDKGAVSEALVRSADEALYRAKERGRNRVVASKTRF